MPPGPCTGAHDGAQRPRSLHRPRLHYVRYQCPFHGRHDLVAADRGGYFGESVVYEYVLRDPPRGLDRISIMIGVLPPDVYLVLQLGLSGEVYRARTANTAQMRGERERELTRDCCHGTRCLDGATRMETSTTALEAAGPGTLAAADKSMSTTWELCMRSFPRACKCSL
jgi:hypothetical protein